MVFRSLQPMADDERNLSMAEPAGSRPSDYIVISTLFNIAYVVGVRLFMLLSPDTGLL